MYHKGITKCIGNGELHFNLCGTACGENWGCISCFLVLLYLVYKTIFEDKCVKDKRLYKTA